VFDLDPGLPELPRVGLVCRVTETLSSATWFGLGPHEAYSDRRAGARLGRWNARVADLTTPYIMPQENGNRHQVRWLDLKAPGESKLFISALEPFDFPWALYGRQLWEGRHWDALPEFEGNRKGVGSVLGRRPTGGGNRHLRSRYVGAVPVKERGIPDGPAIWAGDGRLDIEFLGEDYEHTFYRRNGKSILR